MKEERCSFLSFGRTVSSQSHLNVLPSLSLSRTNPDHPDINMDMALFCPIDHILIRSVDQEIMIIFLYLARC